MPAATAVETYSGRFVDVLEPDPATITLEDIAHALANTCRFGGHAGEFYSVAEHALRVSTKVTVAGGGPLALVALHHDDAEFVLTDVPAPIKPLFQPVYDELAGRIDEAVAAAFGGLWAREHLEAPMIKQADVWALRAEARGLMRSRGEGWSWPDDVPAPLPLGGVMTPEEAKAEFIRRHNVLVDGWFSDRATARRSRKQLDERVRWVVA